MPRVAFLIATAVLVVTPQASGQHVGPDPLFPVVGAPAGTPYPYPVDIARDPNDVPSRALPDGASVTLTAHEIETYLSPHDDAAAWAGDGTDVKFRYFAFGGGHPGRDPAPKVPGPFIRVRQGNRLTVVLDNTNGTATHSIDFHAVVGLKGGASVLNAPPGATVSSTFSFDNPGAYVYHCVGAGTPHGIAHHMNNGMFGIILVEPRHRNHPFNWRVRHATEFYVFQQDIFLSDPDSSGVRDFDEDKMLDIMVPDYSVYNGRVGSLIDFPMAAKVGRNAVIYHGAAGVHVASPHMIGEIWDWVYDQANIVGFPLRNIQTTLVPSAGVSVMIMDGDQLVPTDLSGGLGPELNIFVDHASSYFRKGALGAMVVTEH